MREAFSGYHPLVNAAYFVAVIGFSMFFMHPAALALSFFCAVSYAVYIKGRKALRTGLLLLPMLVFTAVLNPLFNHQGVTILTYFNGNPVTLESAVYGVAAAFMLVTVLLWFVCFNAVVTGEKLVYLFGRIVPALGLVLSMSLRFVPRFVKQIRVIHNAQKGMGCVPGGSLAQKARYGIKILSILTTWALENAVETASGMKARGYGLPGRTAFSIFTFKKHDGYALGFILACTAIIAAGAGAGAYRFRYFPSVQGEFFTVGTIIVFASHVALGLFPLFINAREALYWKRIASAA